MLRARRKRGKKRPEGMMNSIPIETALKIVSSLQVSDVCSLGSCSGFWRELCGSDCVWEPLYRDRWPALDPQTKPSFRGWRECYIDKHKDVDSFATYVVQQFSGFETIGVGQYLSVIEDMNLRELGFKDVQMFFFKQNLTVLINFIGLHYCIGWLGVPTALVGEALDNCKISERLVYVERRNTGWCGHGNQSRTFSLADVSSGKEDRVLGVLRDRVQIGCYRVQISAKNLGLLQMGSGF